MSYISLPKTLASPLRARLLLQLLCTTKSNHKPQRLCSGNMQTSETQRLCILPKPRRGFCDKSSPPADSKAISIRARWSSAFTGAQSNLASSVHCLAEACHTLGTFLQTRSAARQTRRRFLCRSTSDLAWLLMWKTPSSQIQMSSNQALESDWIFLQYS